MKKNRREWRKRKKLSVLAIADSEIFRRDLTREAVGEIGQTDQTDSALKINWNRVPRLWNGVLGGWIGPIEFKSSLPESKSSRTKFNRARIAPQKPLGKISPYPERNVPP